MYEPFVLTVPHKGKDRELEAQLEQTGYTHRFLVRVDETEVLFERDEEGYYRALLPPTASEQEAARLDRELLQAIAQQIEAILS
jgi:hypothetical protein